MALDNNDWVIAGRYPGATSQSTLGVWNFYPSKDAATAAIAADDGRISSTYETGTVEAMTYDEFETTHRRDMLSGPITEVTEEDFEYAFGVLPPLAMENDGSRQSFMMGEPISSTFYRQYVKADDRFFTKLVDIKDRTTWVDDADLPPREVPTPRP